MQSSTLLEPASPRHLHEFKVRMTIMFGKERDLDALKFTLASSSCRIGSGAKSVMAQESFALTNRRIEFNIVTPSLRELGFKKGGPYNDICRRALNIGLWRSPADDLAPQLLLQIRNQPKREILHVPGMKILQDSWGTPVLFRVMRASGASLLDTCEAWPDTFFEADDRFVFVSPRQMVQ